MTGKVIGRVVLLEGVVIARAPDGSQRTLRHGDVVFDNEVIVTDEGGRVELDFEHGGRFLLRARETVRLDSVDFGNMLEDGSNPKLVDRVKEAVSPATVHTNGGGNGIFEPQNEGSTGG